MAGCQPLGKMGRRSRISELPEPIATNAYRSPDLLCQAPIASQGTAYAARDEEVASSEVATLLNAGRDARSTATASHRYRTSLLWRCRDEQRTDSPVLLPILADRSGCNVTGRFVQSAFTKGPLVRWLEARRHRIPKGGSHGPILVLFSRYSAPGGCHQEGLVTCGGSRQRCSFP